MKEFWVIDAKKLPNGFGVGYSCHATRALAVAKIAWYWKKVYPTHTFYIEEIRT